MRRLAALGGVALGIALGGPLGAVGSPASAGSPVAPAPSASPAPETASWRLPIVTKTFANGLTVVVSEDHSAPTFGLCVLYRIGFRLEPKGRTGFAHLFEHLMFEGTPVTAKGVLDRVIEGGGGVFNGSTRYDYTDYIATAPVSALDAILWLEADRMKTLDFSQRNLDNQRDVVKEEIRVNVKNQPYGLFFWTDLSAAAFDKWENSHDGYGSFADLDAANLADVEAFFARFYSPGNAVVAIVGDVAPAEVFARIEKYFGAIPARPAPPPPPEVAEGLNTAERRRSETDALARVPAVAIGWKMPARGTPDHIPAAVLADILVNGDASRLYQRLVKGKAMLLSVEGGIGWPLGDAWTYNGPTLLTLFGLYNSPATAAGVTAAIQDQVAAIARDGVPADELRRAKIKMESDLFSHLELPYDRAVQLAIFQLFSGHAEEINSLSGRIAAVTSDDLKRVAARYLTVANRTVIDRQPAAAGATKGNTP
jgi:zinc protease